ncbi:MAG: hypothetical protein NC189_07650 [Bacteroides sp.]|nr:hypothetical protein [Bacteroides sp.]
MKHTFNRLMILAGCSLAFAACDENSWNDKLPGFEESGVTDVQTLDYTLQPADYKIIADNSANKALAGDDLAKQLAAVGTQCYFTDQITARDYIPALLSDPKFPYFALSDGSSIKITYNVAQGIPTEEIANAAAAEKYVVSDEDYQDVWGSADDYTASFAPSHTAAKSLPSILKTNFPEAKAGDCVIVNYNTSSVDPVFTATPEPVEPGFPLSNVLGGLSSMAVGDQIDVNGVVMAVSTQGPIVADATGSVFAYKVSNNNDLKIGDRIVVSTTLGTFGYGWQLAEGSTFDVQGSQAVTYPAAKTWTGAEIDKFVADAMTEGASPITPVYSKFTGKAIVSKFINIELDGTTVQVSPYGASNDLKALFVDGQTVTFEGYVIALASKGKYLNTVVTKVGDKTISTLAAGAASRAVTVASTNVNAIYSFNGSTWAPMANATILSHADYQAMGQNYDNLSGEAPASLLPIYLKQAFPYAAAGDTKFMVYYYYNGSTTVTRCDYYKFNGTDWTVDNGVVTETAQFVRTAGKWMYDPNVTITLPAGKGIAISTLYYQTCVDWVKNNVPDGAAYVTSYGNNEYYCGTSAYQGNVDLRPSAARTQYAGYDSMTDEEIVALEKKRFETEVFPAALSILHPDAAPVPGLTVLYTINFYYYDGTTQLATIVYEVTAPATFTFVSCTWNPAAPDTPAE